MKNLLKKKNDFILKKTLNYNGKQVYEINIDLEINNENIDILYRFLMKLCEKNEENIICVLNLKNKNIVIENFIKKIQNYINKIKFIINIKNFEKKNIISKVSFNKINKVKGFLTPFLFNDHITREVFSDELFQQFLNRQFEKITEIKELFNNFNNTNLNFNEFIKFTIPNKKFLHILDKEGYNYYNNGWSFTRMYQHLNLLLYLGIKSKSIENKKVLEIGPGLQDFVKIVKFSKSSQINVIDKNIIFILLSRCILPAKDVFHIDLIKEENNLDQISNCDFFFSKGFLNISIFDKHKIEKLVKHITSKINKKGKGYWFTYNTNTTNFNNKILHLKDVFANNCWEEFHLSEKDRKLFGLNYLPEVTPLNFMIEKK